MGKNAKGNILIAGGQVIRPGRRLTVCQSDVFVEQDGKETLCATLLGTFMAMGNTADKVVG